jgi:hypothetical protein
MIDKTKDLHFPVFSGQTLKHSPKTADQMAKLSEKRLILFNSAPNAEENRLKRKQHKKFKI